MAGGGAAGQVVPATALVVAVDPGKVSNRVWLTSGERGLIGEPVSLPVLGEGVDTLAELIATSGVAGAPRIAVEATGRLHHGWVIELKRRWPGSVRRFAPSETQAARTQLGSRRYNSDDRDCAGLVWLVRQGAGRPAATDTVDALLGAVGHRRGLVADGKVLQQRLHDQLQALCPGCQHRPATAVPWIWPIRPAKLGSGLCGRLRRPAADGAIAAGPSARSASPRPPLGSGSTAGGGCFPHRSTPSCAPSGWAEDLARHRALPADIATVEGQLARLLAATDGQILTTLPGVAAVPAASFAAHSLPIDRFPTADHLDAATGLAPATWPSASLTRRGRSSRQGLPEHRDALMGIAWGLSHYSVSFRERDRQLRGRGMRPIQARVALARPPCRLCHALLTTQQPYDQARYRSGRHRRGR